jgi:hypothetical protein
VDLFDDGISHGLSSLLPSKSASGVTMTGVGLPILSLTRRSLRITSPFAM